MIFLFLVLPLFFVMGSTYYYNKLSMIETKPFIVKHSLLEGTFSYLIITFLYLQGFIPSYYIVILIVLLIVALPLLIMASNRFTVFEVKLEIETVKNNIILFSLTILPLYVFLTVFRYLPFYFQIPIALLSSCVIFYSANFAFKLFSPIRNKIFEFFSFIGSKEIIVISGIFIALLLSIALFQFPSNTVGETLNLSNNASYLAMDSFPVDVDNNYRQDQILQLDTTDLIDSQVSDYYYDENFLYLYTFSNQLVLYNLDTGKIDSISNLESGSVQDSELSNYAGELHSMFVEYNDSLILFGNTMVFEITPTGSHTIIPIMSSRMKHYYDGDSLYILNTPATSDQTIYKFENGEFALFDTLDSSDPSYNEMIVISETLFYVENEKYVLATDSNISFDILVGSALYDKVNKTMYYSNEDYKKVTSTGIISEISNYRYNQYFGIIIDENIFYSRYIETHTKTIEIMNSDFEISAIFNHLDLQPFYIANSFNQNYVVNYHNEEDKLEFLQVDKNMNHIVFTIYQVNELDVDIDFPFYSHYGVGILLPIFIAFFIPTTHYRDTYTVSGFFENISRRKRETK